MNRPGIMIRGQVVMAPGYLDRHVDDPMGKRWRNGSRVRLNDIWHSNAVAWDESAGEVIIAPGTMNGDKLPLQLKTGRVSVLPR